MRWSAKKSEITWDNHLSASTNSRVWKRKEPHHNYGCAIVLYQMNTSIDWIRPPEKPYLWKRMENHGASTIICPKSISKYFFKTRLQKHRSVSFPMIWEHLTRVLATAETRASQPKRCRITSQVNLVRSKWYSYDMNYELAPSFWWMFSCYFWTCLMVVNHYSTGFLWAEEGINKCQLASILQHLE